MHHTFNLIIMGILISKISADKIKLDAFSNTSIILNFDDQKMNICGKNNWETYKDKSKIDILGDIFKENINKLKNSTKLDIVFLIDASSSVGENNFKSELKFVRKILSDVTVDSDHTRVAVVTYSSPSNIVKNFDEISHSSEEQTKCLLLNTQIRNINYSGGETFTVGAFQTAKEIFDKAFRNDSQKVLFLITDGYSSGGDPVPLAYELKNSLVTIFTIGIANGNCKELYDLSSSSKGLYSYLLDSYKEFESLARKALHADLKNGDYIPLGRNQPCDILCEEGDCCDSNAVCTCGTTTGHYACVCHPGYYGSGLQNSCLPCIPGTYSGGPNLCLPCPDVHHVTVWPAHGLESCKCKEGYRTTKDNECKVLKCPKISVPKHGYFVKKKECTNVFNSACGIRCEVGYSLVGSSIRLCQLNATWSGSVPTCEVKTCLQLSIPKFGKIKCRHADLGIEYNRSRKALPVDTVCSFECEKGKLLIGSRKRTCLPLSTWDGLRTTCKAIKCSKLPQVKFGKVEPNSCRIGKQELGKTCKITCKEGFQILGPAEKKCIGSHGTWDSKFEDTSCIDLTPPELECPKNITANTLARKRFAYVTWQHPIVTDNSGLEVVVSLKPSISNISNFKFEIGETLVTYSAQDPFYNTAECTFSVFVADNEKPVIENCVDPPPYLVNDLNGANITWDEPIIHDNSHNVKVIKSHEFGYFEIGTTAVTYTATDASGNTNVCKLNLTLEENHCGFLSDPMFGHSKCVNEGRNVHCILTCQEGYAISLGESDIQTELDNTTSVICNRSTLFNEEEILFPECTVTAYPDNWTQDGEVTVIPENNICNNTEKMKELRQYIESTLNNEVCVGNCTIDSQSECETEYKEEALNRIVRRESSIFEEVPHRSKNRNRRKKINVKFQVRGKYLNETFSESNNVKVSSGYNLTYRYNKRRFVCPIGFVPRKNRCVQCPKGTFQNSTTNKCQSCSFGYYNDKLGQTECTSCPLNYSTKKLHSKKASDCKEKCPPGTHAQKKFLKYSRHHPNVKIERRTLKPQCTICPIGYYQYEYGQLSCIQCPSGYTTTNIGSTDLKQCIPTASAICSSGANVCNNGTCVVSNDYEYTCNCFENYFGVKCEKYVNGCISEPCFNGGTCSYITDNYKCICKPGFKGKFCEEEIIECKLDCLNNGTCIEVDPNEFFCVCPAGYGGKQCEISHKHCLQNVCENNGTCIQDEDTFICNCANGFIGRRCNILPCDYLPCGESAICINKMKRNASKDDYSCVCPEGFTGKECQIALNHCQSSPCLNGGTCKNNISTYSCSCHALYHGFNCQYKRNINYELHFQQYDVNNYIKLDSFVHDITEITVCLWMQTADSFNYGTLLSYSTPYTDNAFTLTDYTGLVLYVNNNYVATDIVLNDELWHHLCVIWQSKDGLYKFYVDGNLIKNGSNLSKDAPIQGKGVMIIGQEQDELGGGFSLSESFVGKMAYVDVWSRALPSEEISVHYNDCNESFYGNLYSWPEVQNFIHGEVKILQSSFCNKCDKPKPLYNGNVKILEETAYYSCLPGFELNVKEYLKGRRCTKATKWEGFYEPYCKRVFCGYPGFVKNGYQIGNGYYYGDTIVYNCYNGFDMVGNSTIMCSEDGLWTPNKPSCLGTQCVAFKKPVNSEITILSDYNYKDFIENSTMCDIGTQIEVTCASDTEIIGESMITCTENGTWDFEPPVCKQKEEPDKTKIKSKMLDCPLNQLPAAPLNGYIDLKSQYAAGNGTTNFVKYKCRPGYKLYGDNVTTCIIDGYWTQPNTTCRAVSCPAPTLMENMILKEDVSKKETYSVGNMVSFQCEEGYSMFRNSVIRCMPNGKWSRLQGKCIRKSCGKPNVEGGTIQGKSFLYKDVVTIVCSNGKHYEMVCNKYGVWDKEAGKVC